MNYRNNSSNSGIEYTDREILLNNIIEILTKENRFKHIEKSMPDMILCDFYNSKIFPKSIQHKNTPVIQCSFTVYSNQTVFFLNYFPSKKCENIVKRINNELPYLKTPIDIKSKNLSILVKLDVLDNIDMQMFLDMSDEKSKKDFLKQKIDYFFDMYIDKITDKILEIMLNVVV